MSIRLSCLLTVSLFFVGCTSDVDQPEATGDNAKIGDSAQVLELTEASFRTQVLDYPGVVMVDCWAPWCGPCRELAPIVDELAEEFQGEAVVAKLNIDDAMPVAQEYGVNSIPALLFFKNGEHVDTLVGLRPKAAIAAKLESLSG